MNQQMGLTDFFAMEAGEYLERLDALVSANAPPNTDELVRVARALRGSALMANQQTISATAAAFERLSRGVKDGTLPWDDATKQLAIRAVDDLKVLVRDVRTWSDADEKRAKQTREALEGVAGPPTGLTGKQEAIKIPQGLDAGTRAFIGREGAAVASALDQAAKALQQNPLGHDALQRVVKVMQPLRGLAVLQELPPMGDVLDGVERAISAVSGRTEPVEGAALMFNAAAKALSRAAQEIASQGRADADAVEAQDFTQRLAKVVQEDAVPIEELYHDDAGPHVVQRGTIPGRPTEFGRVELVSHGEHLQKAADELERAQSTTQRELRAQALAATFRALAAMAGGPLANAASDFAHGAREALARGAALHQTGGFAKELRTVGKILSGGGQEDESSAAARLMRSVETLRALGTGAAPTAASRGGGVLSRPRADSAAVAPRPAAASAEEPGGLAGSWARYERYLAALGLGTPSLEELLAGPPQLGERPHASPAPAASPTSPISPARATPVGGVVAGVDVGVVDITTLCYSGRAALERAQRLKPQVQSLLEGSFDRAHLRALIEELLDLFELGLTSE